MSWLLKIVDGPMKGAEIALVDGIKVRVGSGDACDIVVADGSLPAVAFDLDAAESAVTLLPPSGDARVLRPFEAVSFGTSAFVVGPAEGPWQEIVWPKPEEPADPADSEPEPSAEPAPAAPEAEDGPDPAETAEPAPRRRRGCGCGCLVAVLLLLLLAALLALLCRFFPGRTAPYVEKGRACAMRAWSFCTARFASGPARKTSADAALPPPSLAKIAGEHGLELVDPEGAAPLLKGNVARRTERLAIRALALAAKPSVRFDLTDDETLLKASDELLFVVTEGALKAVAASNRVVEIAGYAPNAAKLEQAVRALNADVAGIDRLVTARVTVGGKPPPDAEKTAFVASARPAPANVPAPAAPAAKRDFPIAGILTVPYRCVVMRNGLRLAEGAQVGTAVIEKIESDRLVLRDGRTTIEWRP